MVALDLSFHLMFWLCHCLEKENKLLKVSIYFLHFFYVLRNNNLFLQLKFIFSIYFLIKQLNGSLDFTRICATKVGLSSWDVFTDYWNQRFYGSRMLSLPKDLIKHTSRSRSHMLPPELHSVGLLIEPPKMNNHLFNFEVQKCLQAFLGPFKFFFNMCISHGEL